MSNLGPDSPEMLLLKTKVEDRCKSVLDKIMPSDFNKSDFYREKMGLINLNAVSSFYKEFAEKCCAKNPALKQIPEGQENLEKMFLDFVAEMYKWKIKVYDSQIIPPEVQEAYDAEMAKAAKLEEPFTALEHQADGLIYTNPRKEKELRAKAREIRNELEKDGKLEQAKQIRDAAFLEMAKLTPMNLAHTTYEAGESFARIAWTQAQSEAVDVMGKSLSKIFAPIGGVAPLAGTKGANLYSSPLGKEGATATGNFLEGTGAGSVMDEMFYAMKGLITPYAYSGKKPEGNCDTSLLMLLWNGLSQQYVNSCIANQESPDVTVYLPDGEISLTSVFWNTEFKKFRDMEDAVIKKGGHLYFNVLEDPAITKPKIAELSAKIKELESTIKDYEKQKVSPGIAGEALNKVEKNLETAKNELEKVKKEKVSVLKTCWKKPPVTLPNLKIKGSRYPLGYRMIRGNNVKRGLIKRRLKDINRLIGLTEKEIPKIETQIKELAKDNPNYDNLLKGFQAQLENLNKEQSALMEKQVKQEEFNRDLDLEIVDVGGTKSIKLDGLMKKREELNTQLIGVNLSRQLIDSQMKNAPPLPPPTPVPAPAPVAKFFGKLSMEELRDAVQKSKVDPAKRDALIERQNYEKRKKEPEPRPSLIVTGFAAGQKSKTLLPLPPKSPKSESPKRGNEKHPRLKR